MRTIIDTRHVGSLRSAHRVTSRIAGDSRSRRYLSLHGYQLSVDILQKERKTLSNRVSELDMQIRQLEEKIASLTKGIVPGGQRRPTDRSKNPARDKKMAARQPILGIAVGAGHG